jgi:hypothetical protein
VVRVGATVRRPRGAQSIAIGAFLAHLERAGFGGAPRFLGVDGQGRDVLSFVEGEIAGRPLHPWAVGEDVLAGIARLQRRLHDCSAGFILPEGAHWSEPELIADVPPPYDVADVIGHNDMTPENLIFVARRPVGVIDFDLAGPTTRVADVVTTLLWWAPLRAPADRDPALREADAGRRIHAFVDAYGLDAAGRRNLLDVAERRFARSWHVMRRRAERDGGGWARMWREGVGDVILRGQAWLAGAREALEASLID